MNVHGNAEEQRLCTSGKGKPIRKKDTRSLDPRIKKQVQIAGLKFIFERNVAFLI